MTGKTFAPLHFCATPRALKAFGPVLPKVACAAFLEIGRTCRGYAIHHLQFHFEDGALVAVASRVKASGIVEIDIELGHAGLPARIFTHDDNKIAHGRPQGQAYRGRQPSLDQLVGNFRRLEGSRRPLKLTRSFAQPTR